MFDDDASQFSQDSQDPGDDLKREILTKLMQGVNNGDVSQICASVQFNLT